MRLRQRMEAAVTVLFRSLLRAHAERDRQPWCRQSGIELVEAMNPRQQELLDRLLANPQLGAHSLRTAALAVAIARRIARDLLGDVFLGGLFHDIGKLFLRSDLLGAARALTAAERREAIEQHPVLGALVLQDAELSPAALDGVLHHHERWDGAGYPYGLSGGKIPLPARIVAAAELYDVLTHDQPYRRALAREEALSEMRVAAGGQLDPEVAAIAAELLESTPRAPELPAAAGRPAAPVALLWAELLAAGDLSEVPEPLTPAELPALPELPGPAAPDWADESWGWGGAEWDGAEWDADVA